MLISDMLLTPSLAFPQPAIVTNEKPRPAAAKCADVCAVCGDFSTGYHYEVPSCNGCKTFFRRTIVSERVFKCHKNGNCLFNKDIRCACRACRFKKCLEVGMNPKAIQCSRPPLVPFTPASGHTELLQPCVGIAASTSSDSSLSFRKRTYDISSLLGMETTTTTPCDGCAETTTRDHTDSDSRSGYGSSAGSPRLSKTPRLEHDQIISSLMMCDHRANVLRSSILEPSVSLLDALTKPCGLEDITKYTPCAELRRTTGQWLDIEITLCIEYAKAFESFRNLSISDKCLLVDDTCIPLALLTFAVAGRKQSAAALILPDGSSLTFEGNEKELVASKINAPLERIGVDPISMALLRSIIFLHAECYGLSETGRHALGARRDKCVEALSAHVFESQPQRAPVLLCDIVSFAWAIFQVAAKVRQGFAEQSILYKQVLTTSAVWRQ